MSLTLHRKYGASVMIGDAKVTVMKGKGAQVTLVIDAPGYVRVVRTELFKGEPAPASFVDTALNVYADRRNYIPDAFGMSSVLLDLGDRARHAFFPESPPSAPLTTEPA